MAQTPGTAGELSTHHQTQLLAYMKFAKAKRRVHVREVDSTFEECKDTRLLEDTYTQKEVAAILDGLATTMRANIQAELMHAAHTNVVMLRQMFLQAERWHLRLNVDTAELENQALLQEIARLEDSALSERAAITADRVTVKLPPLSDAMNSGLLTNEIERLKEESATLRAEKEALQAQVAKLSSGGASSSEQLMAANELTTQLRKELAELRTQLERKQGAYDQLKEDFQHVNSAKSAAPAEGGVSSAAMGRTQEELLATQSELRRVLIEVDTLRRELDGKVNNSAPFLNMRKMLNKKNDLIKELRALLQQHAPNAPLPGDAGGDE